MNSIIVQITFFASILVFFQLKYLEANQLKGDPGLLLDTWSAATHVFPPLLNNPRVPSQPVNTPPKIVPTKGDLGDLLVEETRHKKGRQSYNRSYKPRRTNYNHENRHSDNKKNNKGGYHKTDSYNGNRGYSSYSSYDRANRDNYGDSDEKKYGGKGDGHGGGGGGQQKYGGSSYYGDSY